MVAGAGLFLAPARSLAAFWGGLAPLCALQLITGWGKEVPRSGGARRRRGVWGGGKAGGGFDGSNSTFHSLSRFNGRGDQSRDGVIHRDKPIPEEARRKQHCKLCYPRPASSSPAPGRLLQEVPWEPDPLGSILARPGQAGAGLPAPSLGGSMRLDAILQHPGAGFGGRCLVGQAGCRAPAMHQRGGEKFRLATFGAAAAPE